MNLKFEAKIGPYRTYSFDNNVKLYNNNKKKKTILKEGRKIPEVPSNSYRLKIN